jgi:flagellum-specific ATP synthase
MAFSSHLSRVKVEQWFGEVIGVTGMLIEVQGITHCARLGSMVRIFRAPHAPFLGEVVGFKKDLALVMGYSFLEGVALGGRVEVLNVAPDVYPTQEWKGRVLNGLGCPIDQKGPLPQGGKAYSLKATPPPAETRKRVADFLDLGVRSINTFTPCCRGQRLGLFSAAGVGKSVLLGQMARYTNCDVMVVGLVGERGREVNEFLEDHLGAEGLKKAVVIVATSDMPALVRRQAAYLTMTVAELFRDQGLNVVCLMDSLTRFAYAQREIGLSVGEPPTTRGYPPTVFSELSRLLERAGSTHHAGTITGIFSVLVEGDDHDEPISDAARSILDGHITLDRRIAERGRYPAVNVLKSTSRSQPTQWKDYASFVREARKLLATYQEIEDMVHLGVYKAGQSLHLDVAVKAYPLLEDFLSQAQDVKADSAQDWKRLKALIESQMPKEPRKTERAAAS